ncbi:MAG TPA: cation:proton antiporter [Pontiella sp.]
MNVESIIFELSVIIVGAALLGTLFLFLRQPIVIAYLAVGFALGPNGLGLVRNVAHIEEFANVGVILLLFLIGLNLQPLKLVGLFRETALLTFGSALFFGAIAFLFALVVLQCPFRSSMLFGTAMMFSSTVVSLKLVPTTTLHHKRTGEIMTSVLLLQDVLAILVILLISGESTGNMLNTFGLLAAKFILLGVLAFSGVRYVMLPLLRKYDVIQEYTFVATLGWCLFWAEAADLLGLSHEIGAFLAGISIASCPISLIIAEHLKPLREFFLILFFFAIGAELDFQIAPRLLIAAGLFGIFLIIMKAAIFRYSFQRSGEGEKLASELAVRLSQCSEFSLLVAFAGVSGGILTRETAMVIQITTIVTFVLSTYWTSVKYPTPISVSTSLRKD